MPLSWLFLTAASLPGAIQSPRRQFSEVLCHMCQVALVHQLRRTVRQFVMWVEQRHGAQRLQQIVASQTV